MADTVDPAEAADTAASPAFQLRQQLREPAVVVQASGELDMATAPVLDRQLHMAESHLSPPAPLVLDLTGITFLGSSGLTVLADHRNRCAELGVALHLVVTSRAVLRPLQITGLDGGLRLFDTVGSALDGYVGSEPE